MLVQKHGSVSGLANATGGKPSETALRQVLSEQKRSERGTTYVVGDLVARRLEKALKLPEGWMDTPPSYAEIHGLDDPVSKALMVMESMTKEQQHLAVRLIATLDQQREPVKTGTLG